MSDTEVDNVIDGLTEAELEELNEYVDPENSILAASERTQGNTTKAATGTYDRSKLMEHLKKEAHTSEVGKDWLVFDGEKKGREFNKAPSAQKTAYGRKAAQAVNTTGDPELDMLLAQINDSEMEELADTLNVPGLTTQSATHARQMGDVPDFGKPLPVKAAVVTDLTPTEVVPQNTDLEESLRLLGSNDESLTKLNLNNHEEVSSDNLDDICRALLTNKYLLNLQIANTAFNDAHAKILADSLDYNRSLKILNLESNRMTGSGVRLITAVLRDNTSLEEIRLNNQTSQIGSQAECELADMLDNNRTLRKIGYSFKNPGARSRIDRLLMRNMDLARQKRVSTAQVSYS